MAAATGSARVFGLVGETRGPQPIADYGLLADCNTAALVARDGSIDWFCLPRYDSGSVFGRILDPGAGHWSIRPAGSFTSKRRYLPGTLVIETTFVAETGTVTLTDALVFADGQRRHDLGFDAPHELVRSVEGVSGEVELALELAPRSEYGLVRPLFRREGNGGRTFGGPNRICVRAGVPVEIEDVTMRATFVVSAGEKVGFSVRWIPVEASEPPPPTEPRSPPAWPTRSRAGARGSGSTTCIGDRIVISSGSARACSKDLPTDRPAPSSLRRRPPCPRRSAASATGTTATRGSGTPA